MAEENFVKLITTIMAHTYECLLMDSLSNRLLSPFINQRYHTSAFRMAAGTHEP